jgi:hypothetical protein
LTLDPGVTTLAGLVAGIQALRNDAFEAETADGLLDLLGSAGEWIGMEDRRMGRDAFEYGSAFMQRLASQIATIEVQEIGDVVSQVVRSLVMEGLERGPTFGVDGD